MSLFEDAKEALTPMESNQDRAEAREKLRGMSSPGDWLSTILDHHLQLERAFDEAKSAGGGGAPAGCGCRVCIQGPL